jgi:hypothetical protein
LNSLIIVAHILLAAKLARLIRGAGFSYKDCKIIRHVRTLPVNGKEMLNP